MTIEPPVFRYQQLAGFVVGLIECGTLQPGSRAPSLREISRQHGTSLTTALQAYRLLEDRGVLEARPQSGFYIAPFVPNRATPTPTRPSTRSTEVAVSGVMLELLEHASNPKLVPLGCAVPSPELLVSGRLDRCLARVARRRGDRHNVYSPPRGELELRQQIARRAMTWGHILRVDDIAITCGCTEALALALRATAKPGDTIAIESPTYFGLLQLLQVMGLKALELPTDADESVDVSVLRGALAKQRIRACVLSSSFSNPLGCTMPEARKLEVLQLLAEYDVPLIEDDIYGDLHFGGGERPRPFIALDRHDITLYCSSFSKTLAPGYRIGWIATGRRLTEILEAKLASTLSSPVLPQHALAEHLASGGYSHHIRRLRAVFADALQRMTRVIDESFPPGTRVSRPRGGFVLWLELPESVDSRELFQQALARRICFVPGAVFSPGGRYTNCLRVSGGHGWSSRLEKGLRVLGALACEAVERQTRPR